MGVSFEPSLGWKYSQSFLSNAAASFARYYEIDLENGKFKWSETYRRDVAYGTLEISSKSVNSGKGELFQID